MNRTIFDGHLDLAWNALFWDRELTQTLDEVRSAEAGMTDHRARGCATLTFPELRAAGVAVCLTTVLVRFKAGDRPAEGFNRRDLDYASQSAAYAIGQAQLAYYRLMEEQGVLRIIEDANALREHWEQYQSAPADTPLGAILLMEGADPVTHPRQLERWRAAGLRVLGLAHYGQGRYAMGTGGRGPLTELGIELLREMSRLGLILDLTHTSDPGFWQAMEIFDGPVIASHNNCRALVPGDRQFADEQVRAIIDRGGCIGVVMDNWMLHDGWEKGKTPRDAVPLANVVSQIDHICQIARNARHVAIGSDLDGGFGNESCPVGLDSITDLQKLGPMLSERGYSEDDITAIFHGNWLRFFGEHL